MNCDKRDATTERVVWRIHQVTWSKSLNEVLNELLVSIVEDIFKFFLWIILAISQITNLLRRRQLLSFRF